MKILTISGKRTNKKNHLPQLKSCSQFMISNFTFTKKKKQKQNLPKTDAPLQLITQLWFNGFQGKDLCRISY